MFGEADNVRLCGVTNVFLVRTVDISGNIGPSPAQFKFYYNDLRICG